MKIEYLAKEGNHFKANLHCHSTCSDGMLTPEQIKDLYRANGYSIVAYTDHNKLVDHSDLNDADFLALIGTEYDLMDRDDRPGAYHPCYHINFYPRASRQTAASLYDGPEAPGPRAYADAQTVIDRFVSEGYLAQINHPTWSLQEAADYLSLRGYYAIELYNHYNIVTGYDEINTHLWDTLWRSGRQVWGTATDDNHNRKPGTPFWESCGGFTVIQADELTQEAVTDALEKGKFYASSGPMFEEIVLEDDQLRVVTSPVAKITLMTSHRQARAAYPAPGEQSLTEAVFNLSAIYPGYVRLTLTDGSGKQAWSQPITGYRGKQE